MITADLVHRRITNFWGYGSFEAPTWLVGMEEGLGDEIDVEERFRATDGKNAVDMRRDMARVQHHMAWFLPSAPEIQSTFKYPIALYLYFKYGKAPSLEEIRSYQLRILGDIDLNDSCVIDLMPLPARSTSDADWQYSGYVGRREQYVKKYKPERLRQLRNFIAEHRPRLVIFHSLTYRADWASVIGPTPRQITRQMYFVAVDGTAFCVIPNANSRGMSYDRSYEFADRVRSQVNFLTARMSRSRQGPSGDDSTLTELQQTTLASNEGRGMSWRERIVTDCAIHGGDPCIKGTRIPVSIIVGSIADGDTPAQIIDGWPELTEDDIKAALKFAAEAVNNADRTSMPLRSARRGGTREQM
jgi:uncharacterized protein (DUF433 family)